MSFSLKLFLAMTLVVESLVGELIAGHFCGVPNQQLASPDRRVIPSLAVDGGEPG
jgi:hypothetical protein